MTPAPQALFSGPGPRWYNIAAHRPFVDDLALGLYAALSPLGPEAPADAIVLTPTRRGARALAEAFVKAAGGRAVLLPQIRALGDLDEGEPPFEPGDLALDLPPAISSARRRFELARLVSDHQHFFDRALDAAAALELADALAGFLDSAQIEEVDLGDRIDGLVEGELARHWLRSARFLRIATELWPKRLAELGMVDVAERRIALLRGLGEQWRTTPPDRPLIAAGSTGTAPATADLLRVVAEAPQGAVVLPGLDVDLAESAWRKVENEHPQGAMRRLLARAGVERADVRPWPAGETSEEARLGRARRRVVNEALRPAEATADWLQLIGEIQKEGARAGVDPIAEGLRGLSVVSPRTEDEAGGAIALLMRETLETPDRTCALVTPDAALARRVASQLSRWAIAVDSSAGAPLAGFPAGVLIGLLAESIADPLAPAATLALLKHPLVRLGMGSDALHRDRRTLERYGLRGPRPRSWAELTETLDRRIARALEAEPQADGLVSRLQSALGLAARLRTVIETATAPFAEAPAPPAAAARALTEALERLAADEAGRLGELWAGPGGEAAVALLVSLMEDGGALPAATPAEFAQLIARLLGSETVRTGGANHPRLRILGAIEARLIRADRLILAGLEEGVWPRSPPTDPFLSRPMRARLGLPPPERRIGLSAHDFAQAACAGEVVLVHCERREGQPAVKSRWLWRLETLAHGAGLKLPGREEVLAWARALDAPMTPAPAPLQPAKRPAPTPPVEARPTALSVTRVEAWVRDPYAVYARHVLRLTALKRPDEPVEVRARGTAIHTAFERFAEAWPRLDPERAGGAFADFYLQALHEAGVPEPAMARERALAERAGGWVAELEAERRAACEEVLVEQQGSIELLGPAGPFTLSARADRLERANGVVHALDFKTGRIPSDKEIQTGFSPQLTLTAAILAGGGFKELGPREPGDLVYVRVTGRAPPGAVERRAVAGESRGLAEEALDGVAGLVRRYADPAQPYRSRIAPRFVKAYPSDYDHLARVREWSSTGDDEEGE